MRFDKISSKDNEKIKLVLKLIRQAKQRETNRLFVIEGARLCQDAFKSGIVIKWLMFTETGIEKYKNYIDEITDCTEGNYLLTDSVFDKISDTENTQGVLCVCKMPDLDSKLNLSGRYAAVENISNPANLGAISRTVEALGLDGLFLIGNNCDCYSTKALRASMGSLFRLDIIPISYEDIESLKQKGFKFIASVVDKNANKVDKYQFNDGSILIVGNEGNGVSQQLKNLCDDFVTIPINGKAESLNASAAAAILFWEFIK